jgi:hypothetical protein
MQKEELDRLNKNLKDFYFYRVKDKLSQINKILLIYKIRNFLTFLFVFSILAQFIFPPLSLILGIFAPNLVVMSSKLNPLFEVSSFFPFLVFIILQFFVMPSFLVSVSKVSDGESFSLFQEYINSLFSPVDEKVKSMIMPDFLSLVFGNVFWFPAYKNEEYFDFNYYNKLNIFKSQTIKLDDCISGIYDGVRFKLVEVSSKLFHLFQNKGPDYYFRLIFKRIWSCLFILVFGCVFCHILHDLLGYYFNISLGWWYLLIYALFFVLLPILVFLKDRNVFVPPFKGVIIELEMNKYFQGHTFLFEKSAKNYFDVSSFEKIDLEDVDFAKRFLVYSDSQIESRYLLTTALIERIKKMSKVYKSNFVRVAFKDCKMIIVISTNRNMFDFANFTGQVSHKRFVQVFNEIVEIFELIECLKLNEKLGL